MSEQGTKPEIAGAICAPPPQTEAAPAETQPRQPTSLQGLLKFAMEATKTEDAPHESQVQPLNEERKRFLQQALQSLTVDVIEILSKQIKILEKVGDLKENEDATEYTTALNTISDFVCDIDTANDFHKIGGFVILQPCLKCKSGKIRAQACNLLAELSQNNPYCQRVLLENGFMPILIDIVQNDSDVAVVIKALYAISCNIRQNRVGCAQFIQYKGVQVFLEALKRNDEKCTVKICFLLNSLCSSQEDFKNRLVFMGFIPVLCSLLSGDLNSSHEHVLGLLLKLIEDNPPVINEYKQNKGNIRENLEEFAAKVKGKEEYTTEEEYCVTLINILFPQN